MFLNIRVNRLNPFTHFPPCTYMAQPHTICKSQSDYLELSADCLVSNLGSDHLEADIFVRLWQLRTVEEPR